MCMQVGQVGGLKMCFSLVWAQLTLVWAQGALGNRMILGFFSVGRSLRWGAADSGS